MQKINLYVLIFIFAFFGKLSYAQVDQDIEKYCEVVSKYYSVSETGQKNFYKIEYRLGWNKKAPYKIAIQFINLGYEGKKIKFSITDLTSKKMVILDAVHNSRVVSETLNPASTGAIWSGQIDGIKDRLSLRVWDKDGNEIDKSPISIRNKN